MPGTHPEVYERKGGMRRIHLSHLWEKGRHAAQSVLSSLGEGDMLRRVLLFSLGVTDSNDAQSAASPPCDGQ